MQSSSYKLSIQFSSIDQSGPTLQPHELQHARPPCPSPTTRVYSCPLSQWCHPTISSSIVPFSTCLQSFPASGAFQMSQFFTSGGQNMGVSASASVLPMNIQNWFPLGLTGLSPRDSQESSPTPQFKSINSSALSFTVQLSYPYTTTGKSMALTRWTFVGETWSTGEGMANRFSILALRTPWTLWKCQNNKVIKCEHKRHVQESKQSIFSWVLEIWFKKRLKKYI